MTNGDDMKAVAGHKVSSKREILDEDVPVEAEELQAPACFLPVINHVYGIMDAELSALARQTPCFGHLWEDDEGVCPEAAECQVAAYCKAIYVEVIKPEAVGAELEQMAEDAREKAVADQEEQNQAYSVASIAEPGALKTPEKKSRSKKTKNPKLKPINRGEYKDTFKYERHGYHDMGRPVDQSIRRLVHELDYPFELPKTWSRQSLVENYGDNGAILIAKTASYHTILVEGNTAIRVWTNAAGYAVVDLSHLMVAKFKIHGTPVNPIPPKSRDTKKFKDFGGRTYIKNEEDAVRLANVLKETYKVPKKKTKKTTKNKTTKKKKVKNA